jgi:hydroxymethylglutaryl-CoA synthase
MFQGMSRGILGVGAHLPYRRLDRSAIRAVAGTGGGTGRRTIASYDEDTTTMGVEAARLARRDVPGVVPEALWFSTVAPAYLDKANATTVHAALGLEARCPAFDANGSVRSALGALRAGLSGGGPALVVTADLRTGRPGSADEAAGGDAGAAAVVGSADDGPLLAEVVGWGSATEEFLDRWRTPGDTHSAHWEERFGEGRYAELGERAWADALAAAGVGADEVGVVLMAAAHARAGTTLAGRLGVADRLPGAGTTAGRLAAEVGEAGAAQPLLLVAAALDDLSAGADGTDGVATNEAGTLLALVVLADGADVVLLRTTDALAARRPARPVAAQLDAGAPVPYGTYLAWRGYLPVEPPRRPLPARPSAPAADRNREWKFGFVGSESAEGVVHLPPAPGDDRPRPMADAVGTVATSTVDRLAYSPSPPVVFAVVDFDGGGRLPVELTDVDAVGVGLGDRVEMTFRRLFTAEGVHNYFWKARPLRAGEER